VIAAVGPVAFPQTIGAGVVVNEEAACLGPAAPALGRQGSP
jgi:hypothetical protein